jgi:hypothetical protein
VSLSIAVSAIACGSDKSGGGALPGGGGTGKAEVTYQPTARVLEEDEGLAAVLGQSSDGWTLVLDGKAFQGLKAGDVFMIKNQIARKVLAVEPQPDGTIAALTQSATLGEIIQKGKIEIEAGVRFTARGAYLEPLGRSRHSTRFALLDVLEGTAHAGPSDFGPRKPKTPPEEEGAAKARTKMIKNVAKAFYEGWDAEFTATPVDGRVDLDIKLSKSVGGFKALITGKGYLADFNFNGSIEADAGVFTKFRLMQKNIIGRMDFTWEVGKESPGVETGKAYIKLPGAIKIPLGMYLSGLPLFLEISAAALIQPAITGGGEISKGAFHITYDGSQGFSLANDAVNADEGTMSGDTEIDSLAAVAPAAPVGMVVSFAAPRLELSLGLAKVFSDTTTETFKKAAARVDKIADLLIQKTFGDEGLAKWKASPMGGFSLGGAVEKVLASEAMAYFEFEVSTGMTQSGAMAVVPCRQSSIHLAAVVGAGAQFLGLKVAPPPPKTVFKKDYEKVEPPNLKVCQ